MSNITFISCLYKIHDNEFDNIQIMNNHIQHMLNSNLNLILFVDDYYHHFLQQFDVRPTVVVIKKHLKDVLIYQSIMDLQSSLQLPYQRNPQKDTCQYMALMNSKVEFLHLACHVVKTDYIGWIDCGIGKIFKDNTTFEKLANYQITHLNQILIPGCYDIRHISYNDLIQHIYWVFCGGFFILPIHFCHDFYQLCYKYVKSCLSKNMIFWEVNLWILIYQDYPHLFCKYVGDHNDSIISIPRHLYV
ncbi:MAG TPA: WlaTC/HtrL family glycosyltransferase [Candidatus Saccharimonadales bacterium]|nr:WlaTC/HtrL family glycosyltransferase [Candidatus Saccharimonadales bacterium]